MTTIIIGGGLASGDEVLVYFEVKEFSLKTGNIPLNHILKKNYNILESYKQN